MRTTVSTNKLIQRPFDFIRSGSAGRHLNDLYQLIRTDRVVNDWLQRTPQERLSVKTDLKIRVTRTRHIRIRRFYWSLQQCAHSGTADFNARTLILEPESEPQWLDFPDDPQLTTAPELLGNSSHRQVLQYVPLRRLTVLAQCTNEKPTVIKLKRAGRATDASHRLRQINASYSTSPSGFSLPIDLGQCQHQRSYQQTYCPGTPLGDQLNRSPSNLMFEQLGRCLASFHTLSVNSLPVNNIDKFSVFTDKVRHMSALWPTEFERIRDCHDWLQRHVIPATESTLCHGDLSLDNILVEDDHWSLIDLDLAHRGNPVRDIAQILVQLKANSLGSNNELFAMQAAFLSGYQSVRPESVSSCELDWYGCRSQLENLYIALRKDLGDARSRAAFLLRAERHCLGMDR